MGFCLLHQLVEDYLLPRTMFLILMVGMVVVTAVAPDVLPAKVVNHTEYDVWLVHSLTAIRKLQFIGSSVRVRLNRPRPKHLV